MAASATAAAASSPTGDYKEEIKRAGIGAARIQILKLTMVRGC